MTPHDLWPLRWRGPLTDSAIQLVEGTPINCLVVDPSPELKAFAEKARNKGIEVHTLAGEGAVPAAPLAKLPLNSSSPILAVTECAWPRVKPSQSRNSADAGPTGAPWVDSNGWVAQLVRARAPQKAFWLCFDPPQEAWYLRAQTYMLAVADSASQGARWVISFPDGFWKDYAAKKPETVDIWQKTVAAVAFFEQHKQWREFRAAARLGIVSDFTGDNEFLSAELLNLTTRRLQPFRILDKTRPVDLAGLVCAIYADGRPPDAALLAKLKTFVEGGGLLIIQPKAAAGIKGTPSKETHQRFNVVNLGKGRAAIGKEDWTDPYVVAGDAHLLMSHRNDLLWLFNQESCGLHYATSPDGRTCLAEVFRYAARRGSGYLTLAVAEKFRAAQFYNLDSPEPKPLQPVPTKTGVEFHLPEFSVYAALHLGK